MLKLIIHKKWRIFIKRTVNLLTKPEILPKNENEKVVLINKRRKSNKVVIIKRLQKQCINYAK